MATAVLAAIFLIAASGDYTAPARRGDVERAPWSAALAMAR